MLVLNNFDTQMDTLLYEIDGLNITEFDISVAEIILDVLQSFHGYTDVGIRNIPYMQEILETIQGIVPFN